MQNKPEAPHADASIWRTPLMRAAAVLAVPTAFLWGVYLQASMQMGTITLGLYSWVNNVGLLVYSMTALLCALLAGAVLHRSFNQHRWTPEDSMTFYGGLILGAAFQLTGLQFLVFGEWRLGHPLLRLALNGGVAVLVFLLLIQLLKFEWGQTSHDVKESGNQKTTPVKIGAQSEEGG